MTKPTPIGNEDVARDILELARVRATPIAERQRQIDELLEHFRSLPRTEEMLTDDDLYDDDGLPR